MRSIKYADLLNLSTEAVNEITSSSDSFSIIADEKIGENIAIFLNNERDYLSRERTVLSRLRYLWVGRRGFSIVPFVSIWNAACVHGFVIGDISQIEGGFEIFFRKPPMQK